MEDATKVCVLMREVAICANGARTMSSIWAM